MRAASPAEAGKCAVKVNFGKSPRPRRAKAARRYAAACTVERAGSRDTAAKGVAADMAGRTSKRRGSIPAARSDTDGVSHALAARTMPPHLHDRANPDVPPRAFRPTDYEPGLVGDLVSPRPASANRREGAGGIVARGHGAAPSG
jgi:hypothetical protein